MQALYSPSHFQFPPAHADEEENAANRSGASISINHARLGQKRGAFCSAFILTSDDKLGTGLEGKFRVLYGL